MLPDIMLVSSKVLKNIFFMFRLRSLNTLIALHRALSLFELPSRTRHKESLAQSICYGINILYKRAKF